jgi:hypothetical protein
VLGILRKILIGILFITAYTPYNAFDKSSDLGKGKPQSRFVAGLMPAIFLSLQGLSV